MSEDKDMEISVHLPCPRCGENAWLSKANDMLCDDCRENRPRQEAQQNTLKDIDYVLKSAGMTAYHGVMESVCIYDQNFVADSVNVEVSEDIGQIKLG